MQSEEQLCCDLRSGAYFYSLEFFVDLRPLQKTTCFADVTSLYYNKIYFSSAMAVMNAWYMMSANRQRKATLYLSV